VKKIAFIDIGPGGIQYFHEVAQRMEGVDAVFYSTRPKVRSILKQLGAPQVPDRRMSRNKAASPPDDLLQHVITPKSSYHISDRGRLIKTIHEHYWHLKRLFDAFLPDAILVWNGSGLVATIALYLARQRKVATLFGENGYFHNTMQLDPEGVNFASSFTRTIADEYPKTVIEPGKLKSLQELIKLSMEGKLPRYEPPKTRIKASLWSKLLVEAKKLSLANLLSPRLGLEQAGPPPAVLPERYIFLPFQVTFDSQLLLYSPLVGNDMHLFVRRCYEAVKLAAPEHTLVVKLHPAESSAMDYRGLIKAYPDIVWLGKYPVKQILASADLVITINSTVGLEGVMANKPVITLGQNFYNVPGIVQHLTNLADLPEAIAQALKKTIDYKNNQQFLYHVYYKCFVQGNKRNFSEQSFQAVTDRMRQLLGN
jgi:capsular polysaccharide export protein